MQHLSGRRFIPRCAPARKGILPSAFRPPKGGLFFDYDTSAVASRAAFEAAYEDPLFATRERGDHIPGFVFGRRDDDLRLDVLELLDVVALDVLKLDFEHSWLRPFAIGAVTDVADDSLE